MRILTTICCVVAIVALYGCGGSSQLGEVPTGVDEFLEGAQVRISATGGRPFTDTNQGKAFFAEDPFAGTGAFDGEGLADGVTMECEYLAPVLVDKDGAGPLDQVDIQLETDAANCVGERNCCVYALSGRGEPCSIDIVCLVDPDGVSATSDEAVDLANTGIRSEFKLYQVMTTNMQNLSGVVMTAVDSDQSVVTDDVTTDFSAINIDRTSGSPDCNYAYKAPAPAQSGNFEVLDDTGILWAGLDDYANDSDILDEANFAWNVDQVGIVGTATDDITSIATCELIYDNMFVTVTLEDVSTGGTTADDVSIIGKGRICNDTSYTNCEGDDMWDYTLHGEDGVTIFPPVP